MPVVLENLTNRPVLLVLSSGATLRLSPGGKSADLADVEVETNSKVDKLVAQGVIAVHEPPKRSTAGKAKKSANPQAGRDKDEGEGDKTTE